MKKSTIIIASGLAVAIGAAGITAAAITSAPQSPDTASVTPQEKSVENTLQSATPETATETNSPATSTADLLVYLIEEEKLAHDVYTVLGQTWGGNTFTNILASESTHQNQVLALLNTYGITDPRSTEIGVFTNPDLQALYDQLIAQGLQSQTEAYKVGVLIEETDIADLTEAMATTNDTAILDTLTKLRSASESHLSAFSRKL